MRYDIKREYYDIIRGDILVSLIDYEACFMEAKITKGNKYMVRGVHTNTFTIVDDNNNNVHFDLRSLKKGNTYYAFIKLDEIRTKKIKSLGI